MIELFGTNQVLVHFDTDANRAYTLQYLDPKESGTNTLVAASNGLRPNHWSNLAAFPATPFPNHYIIVDTRTNSFRLYRLAVSP